MAGHHEKTHVWADGFGRWHARIVFPRPGYTADELARHSPRLAAKARRAIRRELSARDLRPEHGHRVRVLSHQDHPASDGRIRLRTYRERD